MRRKRLFLMASLALSIGSLGQVLEQTHATPSENALPQGYGLSAKYPGDRGIGRDPAILFAEDFEAGDLQAVVQHWSEASNKDGKILAFSTDTPPDSAGKRSL